MPTLTEDQASDFLQDCVDITSLPMLLIRLNNAINNPRSSITDIAKIISEDTSLSARLLRIVNGSLYGFPSRIDTINRAVVIVGTQQLRDLAMATSVTTLFKEIPDDLVNMESFWRHSVGCGLAAREIANLRQDINPERYFVAGILHDVGRLVMIKKDPSRSRSVLLRSKRDDELLYKSEAAVFGFDHSDIGRLLLNKWKLPSSLEEAVAFHHRPRKAVRYPLESAIIHLADVLCHAINLGKSGERFVPPLSDAAWKLIGLAPSTLSPIIEQVDRQFNEIIETILVD